MIWVLVLLTAQDVGKFTTEVQGGFQTISECHVSATKHHWEEAMPVNKELVCMAVEKYLYHKR
tara:strand:+ start:1761 stop:1949 length:189 start_codon:yes stop_codon:yes gene_type:complete